MMMMMMQKIAVIAITTDRCLSKVRNDVGVYK